MAVFEVVAWDVKPGRREEFLSLARDLKGICQRVDVGLTSIRMLESTIGGPNSGRISMVFEHADLAAWGSSVTKEQQDAEFQALSKQSDTDPSATLVSRTILTEIEF